MRREPCVAVVILAVLASCGAAASGDEATRASEPIAVVSSTLATSTIPIVTSTVESDEASVFAEPRATAVSDPMFNATPPTPISSPDLGVVADASTLVAALKASGPLDNEMTQAVAAGSAPGLSICASIVQTTEPSAGTVVHQALATLGGQVGVVLVLQRDEGHREARLYGTGEADPATGGCPLWISTPV